MASIQVAVPVQTALLTLLTPKEKIFMHFNSNMAHCWHLNPQWLCLLRIMVPSEFLLSALVKTMLGATQMVQQVELQFIFR